MNNELFEYEINDNSVTILKFIGNQADVVIPPEIDGYPVTRIGNNAFRGNLSLTSADIPESVTEIGEDAFSGCSSLKTVVFKNNDTILNRGAFDYCSNLQIPIKTPPINRYIHEHGFKFNVADLFNASSSSPDDSRELYARANSFYNGSGVEQNYEEAFKLYLKAAQLGHVEAMNSLGVCYENGQGADQNYIEAAKWYRQAAERGYSPAQHNLGICYEIGQGVALDYSEAVKWYRKAAMQGYGPAQNNLGICYEIGQGVVQNFAEAVRWYQLSAEQGYGPAQYNLGVCYSNGRGIEQDNYKAYDWIYKASQQGVVDAIVLLPSIKSAISLIEDKSILFKNGLDNNDIKIITHYVEQGLNYGYSYYSPSLSKEYMTRLCSIINVVSWIFLFVGGVWFLRLLEKGFQNIQDIVIFLLLTITGIVARIYIHRTTGAVRISMNETGFFCSKWHNVIPWNTISDFNYHFLVVHNGIIQLGVRVDLSFKLKENPDNYVETIRKVSLFYSKEVNAFACVLLFQEYLKRYQSYYPDSKPPIKTETGVSSDNLDSLLQNQLSGTNTIKEQMKRHIN